MEEAAVLRLQLLGDPEVLVELDVEHLGHLQGVDRWAGLAGAAEEPVAVSQGQDVQEVFSEGAEGETDEDESEVGDGVLVLVAVAELDALVSPRCCSRGGS